MMAFGDPLRIEHVFHFPSQCLMIRNLSLAILRPLSQSCGKLKGATESRWRDANDTAEDLGEVTGTCVADFETDLDEAARSFADQLLGAGNPLAGDELQGGHAHGLLENVGKM